MPIRYIIVALFKQIGIKIVPNARTLYTNQTYCRAGVHLPSNKTIIHRYRNLGYDQHKVQATYIWIDGTGENIRLKDRILDGASTLLTDTPKWSYAENSPYQTLGGNSVENMLYPRAIYRNPFKVGKHDIIVLCDTYKPDGSPFDTNHRHAMQISVDKTKELKPKFGIEQQYTLIDIHGHPFQWPKSGFIEGIYSCSVGCNRVHARDLVESHALACLYAGIHFGGTNAEEFPSQWKYRIGPSVGMRAADDLWVSRYILMRIAEEFGICITFHPKLMDDGRGETCAHTSFSTTAMRADGGMQAIREAIKRLEYAHEKHIKTYDEQDLDQSSSMKTFSWGDDRDASIRVLQSVIESGKGFLVDRRPPSNMDPYIVCNGHLTTTLLNE